MTESTHPATEVPPGTTKNGLDIHDILKILPHRYPLLLIDRVVELKRKERIVGNESQIKQSSCHNDWAHLKSSRSCIIRVGLTRLPYLPEHSLWNKKFGGARQNFGGRWSGIGIWGSQKASNFSGSGRPRMAGR